MVMRALLCFFVSTATLWAMPRNRGGEPRQPVQRPAPQWRQRTTPPPTRQVQRPQPPPKQTPRITTPAKPQRPRRNENHFRNDFHRLPPPPRRDAPKPPPHRIHHHHRGSVWFNPWTHTWRSSAFHDGWYGDPFGYAFAIPHTDPRFDPYWGWSGVGGYGRDRNWMWGYGFGPRREVTYNQTVFSQEDANNETAELLLPADESPVYASPFPVIAVPNCKLDDSSLYSTGNITAEQLQAILREDVSFLSELKEAWNNE